MKERIAEFASAWAEPLTEAAIIIIALFLLIWPIKIHGSSMQPSINDGDWVFGSKLAAIILGPKSGDIVLFKVDGEKGQIIKRIVALPGDKIEIKDGSVYVNDEILHEYYIVGETDGSYSSFVRDGYFFALGDNRPLSTDSRDFGQVPIKDIKSKILLRFYPLNNITTYFLNFKTEPYIATSSPGAAAPEKPAPKVAVNGLEIIFDTRTPAIVDGRILVPVREVFTALGFEVDYDSETTTATLENEWSTISIKRGDSFFTVDGEKVTPDVPPQIIGGSFMLPLRAVAEATGAEVSWDPETNTAYITAN